MWTVLFLSVETWQEQQRTTNNYRDDHPLVSLVSLSHVVTCSPLSAGGPELLQSIDRRHSLLVDSNQVFRLRLGLRLSLRVGITWLGATPDNCLDAASGPDDIVVLC